MHGVGPPLLYGQAVGRPRLESELGTGSTFVPTLLRWDGVIRRCRRMADPAME